MVLDWKQVAQWLGWAVAMLLAYMGRDALKRIEHLENTSVSKTDLENLEDRLNSRSDEMHGDNGKRLEGIATGIRETHGRIDDLYRDLMKRND